MASATDAEVALPSLSEIRGAMPAKCFDKSLRLSFYFLVQDFLILGVLYYFYPSFRGLGIAGLLVWWNLMGVFMCSLFVIGHDCGHGSFSNHRWLNDIVGHVCHAPLLSPYWPWQKSHRLHHTYTSHLHKDYGHPWVTKDAYEAQPTAVKWFSRSPISAFFRWFPIYTVAGLPDGSHFWPFSGLFSNSKERWQCLVSGLACAASVWLVYRYLCGDLINFTLMYLVPVFFYGFLLITITYLQHQDFDVQVFEDGHWSYLKGAFQTFDRPYGFGLDYMLHHITDGHVAHHLFFTQMPHYRLRDATKALRSFLRPFGVYKRRTSYDFLLKFAKFNFLLHYVDGKGTLTYPNKEKNSD